MRSLLSANPVWSIGIHSEPASFQIGDSLGPPIKVFNSRGLRTARRHVHTRADPFLLVHQEALYVFYEEQRCDHHGTINAYKTKDLRTWKDLGVVLEESFHVSYPHVFIHQNEVYLIPESSGASEVALYRFEAFPDRLEKARVLRQGRFVDSTLLRKNDSWFLFTTSEVGLEMFSFQDLLQDELLPHPLNPICADSRYSRCGGGIVEQNGRFYRAAQDGSRSYGEKLHLLEVTSVSQTEYSESLAYADVLPRDQAWNRDGGHHMSSAHFQGRTVLAVDGLGMDLRINKLISMFLRVFR